MKVLFFQELRSRGHQIDWLMQSANSCCLPYQTEWMGCKLRIAAMFAGKSRVQRLLKHLSGGFNDLYVFGMALRNKYDFIQVKDKFVSALLAILAARMTNTPFIYWLSFPFPEASLYRVAEGTARYPTMYRVRGHFYKYILYKIILPASVHVFVQSEQMKRDIQQEGISPEKMTAVPMGVDLQRIEYPFSGDLPDKRSDEKWLVYLGTLVKTRRIDFLVRVLAIVLKHHPEAVLYLVGAGDDDSDEFLIRKQAEALNVDNRVRMTGFLPMNRAWGFVSQADVCLSPFYPTPILNSTSPTKLIEYMALAKPVVANDHPEQRLVIQQSAAGVCVAYDENAFADAIEGLLDDPEKAEKMGRDGRQYIEENRSYTVIADRVDKTYKKICAVKSGNSSGWY